VGVHPTTLGWWRWRLGAADEALGRPGFADVVLVPDRSAEQAPDFVVELADVRVRVSPGFDAPELRRLLAALC